MSLNTPQSLNTPFYGIYPLISSLALEFGIFFCLAVNLFWFSYRVIYLPRKISGVVLNFIPPLNLVFQAGLVIKEFYFSYSSWIILSYLSNLLLWAVFCAPFFPGQIGLQDQTEMLNLILASQRKTSSPPLTLLYSFILAQGE